MKQQVLQTNYIIAGIHMAKSVPHYFSYQLKRPSQNCEIFSLKNL